LELSDKWYVISESPVGGEESSVIVVVRGKWYVVSKWKYYYINHLPLTYYLSLTAYHADPRQVRIEMTDSMTFSISALNPLSHGSEKVVQK
jgi:hypothetical protein